MNTPPSFPIVIRLLALGTAAVFIAGCNSAQIQSLSATDAAGATPIRAGAGLKIVGPVQVNGSIRNATISLTPTRPVGPAISIPENTLVTNGNIRTLGAEVTSGNTSVPLEQGSRWNGRLTVKYVYGWTEERTTMEVAFEVIEPVGCFGFVDSPKSLGWTLEGYFKNDGATRVSPSSRSILTQKIIRTLGKVIEHSDSTSCHSR